MPDGKSWTPISIKYKSADGWHVFTSPDMPGLYVASKDAEAAYNDVLEAIKLLMRLDHGIECDASHGVSLEQFIRKAGRSAGGMDQAVGGMGGPHFPPDQTVAVYSNAA